MLIYCNKPVKSRYRSRLLVYSLQLTTRTRLRQMGPSNPPNPRFPFDAWQGMPGQVSGARLAVVQPDGLPVGCPVSAILPDPSGGRFALLSPVVEAELLLHSPFSPQQSSRLR